MTSPIVSTLLLMLAASPLVMAQQKPAPVRIVRPTITKEAKAYEIPGYTEPVESATIFTRSTGIVRERNYDIGDRVKENDILATIEVPELDHAVAAARAAIDEATARAKSARALSARSSTLLQARAVSQEETEQRQFSADQYDAAVIRARAELARLEELQKFATVRAPFNGTISARNFDRGDRVRGDAATSEGWLYKLVRLNTLRFTLNATPDLAMRLTKDAEVSVRFNELPGKTFKANVSRTSKIFDLTSGTMRVELLLDNKDLILPSGLTGTASFSLPPVADTYLVPTNTLVIREGKTTLSTVAEGKVKLLEVLPGRNFGPNVEVTSHELSAETQVIINPNAMLRPGDAVEIAVAEDNK